MKAYLFACIEKNIGDDLFVKLLCERYPQVDFIISEEAKYGSLEKISNLHFSKKMAQWIWATSLKPHSPVKKLVAVVLRAFYSAVLPKCDIGISIVGNAFKNMAYTGWAQSRWIRSRLKLVDRFYLISTNFGPYHDHKWKEDFDKIYPQMADVCFRDEYSYQLFQNLPNTRFAPDAVLSMGEQQVNEGIKKRVMISLIDCALNVRSEALHRAADTYESRMIEVAQKYLSEGYQVTFLNSNTQQDRPACDRIMSQLPSDNVDVVDYDGDLDVVFDLYRNSSCVVATRLHTIVLAWLYRLPVVPIVYDIKVENLLNSYHFNACRYDIKNLDNVSGEDIFCAMNEYDYILPQETIQASQLQFKAIDIEFSKKIGD